METMKELAKERKKLCALTFFCKVMGYTYSWINQAEHEKVKVSAKFIEEYKNSLEDVKKIVKK